MTQQCSPDIVARLRKGEAHGVLIPCEDLKEAADEIERLRRVVAFKERVERVRNDAQSAPEQISFVEALSLAERGLELWKAKEHNAKWWRRIDGTPIPNDLLVNIAEEFSKCGLVYASTLPSAQCGDPIPSSPDVSAPDRRPPE